MHFPLLPLIDVLRGLSDVNFSLQKSWAQAGLLALGIAIFVSIVDMGYILTVAMLALAVYLLVYWVLWRYLIKNMIAAIRPEKPEDSQKEVEDLERYP